MVGRRFGGANSYMSVVVDGVNNMGPMLNRGAGQVTQFVGTVETQNRRMSRALGVGRRSWLYWAGGITAGLVAAERQLFNVAKTIETEWTDVTTLLPTATERMTSKMKKDLLDYATFTGTDWVDAIQSGYKTVSAVFTDPADQRRMITAAENLAKAIRVPLSEATRLIIAGANAFGETSEEFERISDLYTIGIRYGVTTGEEMTKTLAKVLPVAKALGFGLEEVVAAHAALTNAGLESAEAAVNQRQMYTQLLQVAQDVGKQFEEQYGQTPKQFVEAGNDYVDLMNAIVRVSEKSGHSMYELFGRVQSANAAQILTSTRGIEILDLAMQDADGAATVAANKVRDTTQYTLDQMNAQYKKAAVTLGDWLTPTHLGIKELGLQITDTFGLTDQEGTRASAALLRFNAIIDETPELVWESAKAIEALTNQVDALSAGVKKYTEDYGEEAFDPAKGFGIAAITAALETDFQSDEGMNRHTMLKSILGIDKEDMDWIVEYIGSSTDQIFEYGEFLMRGNAAKAWEAAGDASVETLQRIRDMAAQWREEGISDKEIEARFDVLSDSHRVLIDKVESDWSTLNSLVNEVMASASLAGMDLSSNVVNLLELYDEGVINIFEFIDALSNLSKEVEDHVGWMVEYRRGMVEVEEALKSFTIAHEYGSRIVGDFEVDVESMQKMLSNYRNISTKELALGTVNLEDHLDLLKHQLNTYEDIDADLNVILDLKLQIKSITGQIADEAERWVDATANARMNNIMYNYYDPLLDYDPKAMRSEYYNITRSSGSTSGTNSPPFDFDAAWVDAQWGSRFGMFENFYDEEKQHFEWKREELNQTAEMYKIIEDRLNKVQYGTQDWISLQVQLNELAEHAEEVFESIAAIQFNFASAYEDEQFSRRTGKYGNTFDQRNYLEFGKWQQDEEEDLRKRLAEIIERSIGLTGEALFRNQSEQRRLMDQIFQLGQMEPPDKRTALNKKQKEMWDIEDLKHGLGDIPAGDYIGLLRSRQDFWRGVGLETEVLRIEQQIRNLEEQNGQTLDEIVAQPIIKALEEQTDNLTDAWGRIIEVEPGTDPRGRAVAGQGLEYAATKRSSRLPISVRK